MNVMGRRQATPVAKSRFKTFHLLQEDYFQNLLGGGGIGNWVLKLYAALNPG
jgi:hypothetical protein